MFTAACGGGADTGNNSGSNGSSGDQTFLTIPREDMGTFTRNFNPFSPSYLPMTGEAIYERMFIYSSSNGEITPWLATEWSMNDDSTQATFTLRDGVKWSDGAEPLVADDVVTSLPPRSSVEVTTIWRRHRRRRSHRPVRFRSSFLPRPV